MSQASVAGMRYVYQITEIANLNAILVSSLGKFEDLRYIERAFNINEIDHEYGSERPGEA
jgi:hypothetical protein